MTKEYTYLKTKKDFEDNNGKLISYYKDDILIPACKLEVKPGYVNSIWINSRTEFPCIESGVREGHLLNILSTNKHADDDKIVERYHHHDCINRYYGIISSVVLCDPTVDLEKIEKGAMVMLRCGLWRKVIDHDFYDEACDLKTILFEECDESKHDYMRYCIDGSLDGYNQSPFDIVMMVNPHPKKNFGKEYLEL